MITRYDYFIGALKAKAHYARDWMLRALSIVIDDVATPYPWALRHADTGVEVYVPIDGGFRWEVLEGAKRYEIPFVYHDFVGQRVKAFDVENLKEDVDDVTWGDLIFNSRVLVYAAGDIIPFIKGMVNLGDIEKLFVRDMRDDPEPGEEAVPGQLYVMHWVRFGKAIGDLCGYEFFVPSVTEKALQPPPNRDELRSSLLEKYKGQLDDPVIQSRIQNELVAAYKDQQLKGDPSEGFIYKNKSINTALKRMFLIHGPEAGFEEGGRATLVINSLSEGLDVDKYPEMVNSLRAGSYYRGALTALAGEDVDLMGRVFQNARVQAEFCGTQDTLDVVISKQYLGRTIRLKNGKHVLITEENLKEYEGQLCGMFSPMYCKAPMNDTCKVCVGEKISAYPTSLGSIVGQIPSVMMALMMGSAHAKELKTTPLDIENFLR